MKKIFLTILSLMLAPISGQMHSEQDQEQCMKNQLGNDRVVIAFDLHEVVFRFSYKKLCHSVCTFFTKNPYTLTLCNPVAGYRVYTTFQTNSKTAENIYDKITHQYYPWLADSKSEFLSVCNSYIVDPEMKTLLEQLKQQGYRLAVCSNIGHHAYEAFREHYPDIFELFDVIVVSHPERNYLRKPAPEFFEHFKKKVDELVPTPTRYIFCDDKKRNVHAAQECGIEGIVFKNATQFRHALALHGVVLGKPDDIRI